MYGSRSGACGMWVPRCICVLGLGLGLEVSCLGLDDNTVYHKYSCKLEGLNLQQLCLSSHHKLSFKNEWQLGLMQLEVRLHSRSDSSTRASSLPRSVKCFSRPCSALAGIKHVDSRWNCVIPLSTFNLSFAHMGTVAELCSPLGNTPAITVRNMHTHIMNRGSVLRRSFSALRLRLYNESRYGRSSYTSFLS